MLWVLLVLGFVSIAGTLLFCAIAGCYDADNGDN